MLAHVCVSALTRLTVKHSLQKSESVLFDEVLVTRWHASAYPGNIDERCCSITDLSADTSHSLPV
jgi:hypothetical protein